MLHQEDPAAAWPALAAEQVTSVLVELSAGRSPDSGRQVLLPCALHGGGPGQALIVFNYPDSPATLTA
ncbi:hypothetical protein [Crossiella sp. CA198]|uniref:hypothetical protein n=1 Tax=Crossiella sp. CA198 TaxID=3455607 RepID=UPI003F8CF4D6